jgi:hypothetical protein
MHHRGAGHGSSPWTLDDGPPSLVASQSGPVGSATVAEARWVRKYSLECIFDMY